MEPPAPVYVHNETTLNRALATLQRRFEENEKQRIKHSDNPAKFGLSETELFVALDTVQNVGSQPELFYILATKRVSLRTVLTLIGHENKDISEKVLSILEEMTESADEPLEREAGSAIVKALIEEGIINSIVANFSRLDNQTDTMAIVTSFEIIENLIQFEANIDAKQTESLFKWILESFKKCPMTFNHTKPSFSATLATLLVRDVEYKISFGRLGGIDVLLQQVAPYRLKAPETSDEHEFMEQTFDNLIVATLDCEENREIFYQEEGIDLIKLIFFEKTQSVRKSNIKYCSLKLLSFILTTRSYEDTCVTKCCERFIEIGGLKVIFRFLETSNLVLSDKSAKSNKSLNQRSEIEDYCSSIILNLLKHCRNSDYVQRLLTKFAESNFEKFTLIIRQWTMNRSRLRIMANKKELVKLLKFIRNTYVYIILMVFYLSQQYDTHDPISGETFMKYLRGNFDAHCQKELDEDIMKLMPELEVGSAVFNSLELISAHYHDNILPALKAQKGSH